MRFRNSHALPIAALFLGLMNPAFALLADSTYLFQYTLPMHMARALPVSGPEAAPLNPARLAQAPHWYSEIGRSAAGHVAAFHTGVGATVGYGIRVGMSGFSVSGTPAGTNAVFLEQRDAVQAAWELPRKATGPGFSLGYALIWHSVNAFGAYKASGVTHDLGLTWRTATRESEWGFDLGLALRDLDPIVARIPEGNGNGRRYQLYGPNAEATSHIESPGGVFSAWGSLLAESGVGPSRYGPFEFSGSGVGGSDFQLCFDRYGIGVRPLKVLSLRVENLGYDVWQTGATLGAGGLIPFRLEADAALSHGYYYAYTRPSGTGWTLALALRSGW